MSEADQTATQPKVRSSLRQFLYYFILVAGGSIFQSTEVLHWHEALLASGLLVIVAVLLVEPTRQEKFSRAFDLFFVVLSFYLLVLKLPALLVPRVNYYVAYALGFVLVVIVLFGGRILWRRTRTER